MTISIISSLSFSNMVNNQITMTNFSLLLLLLLSNLLHPSSASRRSPMSRLDSLPSLKSFNVLDYGAKGDGESDSTSAFSKAWNDACSSSGEVQIYVPKGDYMLRHLSFEGGCKTSNIVFRIDGTLIATGIFKTFSWILFHKVDGLHIKGGVLDAKGESLWECKNGHKQCPKGAMSLSFDNSKNVVVEDLTSKDSQMYHITINDCQNVKLVGVSISADGNSPNTDGTHIEGSQGVTIMQSSYQTGDDCISIGPNNQNIWVEDVHCGPGHGISIGSLGKQGSSDNVQVRNVTVKSTVFTGSDNGLRIKTWASPIEGVVQDIFYLGAQMNSVKNPIIIDQHYCPNSNNCPSSSQASNIQLKNIVYKDIQGTSSIPVAITFDCSSKSPCEGLTLQDIKLSYNSKIAKSECENAYGKSTGLVQPSSCLS